MFLSNLTTVHSYTVGVFGGSGYVGRRITESLVQAGCDVISISRSGKPPSFYHNSATDSVHWISHNLDPNINSNSNVTVTLNLPKMDAAISCIGNVNPIPEWEKNSFWGLGWDDDILYHENGIVNQEAMKISKAAGATRFVFLSVSYEVAKMVEGPLAGYMKGKRHAEHVSFELFGDDDAIVLGPSLIYGGKRFSTIGPLYRKIVESPIAKAYLGGNEALRKLSFQEDWVEKVLFSPPVDVSIVARVACAAALGLVTRDMVGERRQGFFDTNGQPICYDDVIFVDGTKELERVDQMVKDDMFRLNLKGEGSTLSISWVADSLKKSKSIDKNQKEPPFEGALIGKGSYLFPLPVVAIISATVFAMTSGAFISVNAPV